jgi:hypothetical protein
VKQAAAQVVSLPQSEAAQPKHIGAANDDQKPVIVTARRPGRRLADVSDMAPEEHKRRGDAADALFREIKHRIAQERP